MSRAVTALFAALEALLVVGVGVGIPLAVLTVLWAFQYGLQVDWIVFWRAAADTWLLGHGVDVTMTLSPALALGIGVSGAATPFIITIAPLGFALITVLLGARAGRRIGETPHRQLGTVVSVAVFAALSLAVTLSALFASARASIWQGTLLPTLCFAIGLAIGVELGRRSLGEPEPGSPGSSLRDWIADWRPEARSTIATGLRAGAASAGVVIAVSAVAVALLLLTSYAKVITLYEGVHAGVLGGIALTVGQLALLPNLIIWAASWLIGPGFAIGTGSSVSPFGTSLGPIPAVPVLGALPSAHQLGWGFLSILVPVLAAFFVAVLLRRVLVRELGTVPRTRWLLLAGAIAGVTAGVVLGLLAWASAGSAGPGRLVDVGPSPWLTGAFAALEVGIAAIVGMLAGRTTTSV
ncbi:MAG: hypothetical protein JWN80_1862 [Microbacteriaceae bacterium]|nr:hypothetical protein [Microbacteriaceae bacterium]